MLGILLIAYPLFSIFNLNNNLKQQQDFNDMQSGVLSDVLFTDPLKQAEWNKMSCEAKKEFLERQVMISLSPQIHEAVNKYYGELRGYDLEKIIDVKAIEFLEYEIKIQISTFVGPHNPPYGLDVVTVRYRNLCDGKVVNYEHKTDM